MRNVILYLLIIVSPLIVGCSRNKEMGQDTHFTRRSGDLGEFLIVSSKVYGASSLTTNPQSSFTTDWLYKADGNGIQVMINKTDEQKLIVLLREVFGEPRISMNYPHVLYRAQDIGAALMCNLSNDPIHVICIQSNAF